MRLLLTLMLAMWCVHAKDIQEVSREKRFSAQSCKMSPENDEENVIEDSREVTITCTFDSEVDTCSWLHMEPMNEGTTGSNGQFDIKCTSTKQDSGKSCDLETRITFQMSGTSCGITVGNTIPEDTGKWRLNAGATSNTGAQQQASREIELFTYNQSTYYMWDEDFNDIDDIDVDYNFNTKRNEWEKDKSNWETVEVQCVAFGGRPEPTLKWYIENNDNDDLEEEGFKINQQIIGTEDRNGYIRNIGSTISFAVDDKLMELLERYNIDINPKDEVVTFELNCDIDQGMYGTAPTSRVRININKSYDDGNLAADTIGLIVGVIVAVVLLVLVIALLIFAKASGRWCFEEDERDYHEPRKVPRTAAQQPQRQHRR